MNWDEIITTAPYNTLNLPVYQDVNLTNPHNMIKKVNAENPRKTHRVPLGTEIEFFDPTAEMVENYLDTNMSMYDNRGKYFDTYLFNQKFDQYIEQKNSERLLKQKVQLNDLDTVANIQIAPYQLPIDKLLINLKNVWFDLYDQISKSQNPIDTFTTENLFYYGISFIAIFLLYIMLSYIFE